MAERTSRLGNAIWGIVGAHIARAVAAATALSVESLGLLVPVIAAAAAAGAAAVYAVTRSIPRRHIGGDIWESGPYSLLAGEHVLSREQAAIYRTAIYAKRRKEKR